MTTEMQHISEIVVQLQPLDPTFTLEPKWLRRCSISVIVVQLLPLDLKCYAGAKNGYGDVAYRRSWCNCCRLILNVTLEPKWLRQCSISEIVVQLLSLDPKHYAGAKLATEMQHIGERGATAAA